MNAQHSAAEIVETHAADIAKAACEHLISERTEIHARFGEDAAQLWTEHLNQRALELAAAIASGDPDIFASRLTWSRAAMQARNITPEDLQYSLRSLKVAVEEQLQGEARDAAMECINKATHALSKPTEGKLLSQLDAGLSQDRLALQYVQAVLAGNVFPGMQLVLDAVSHGLPIEDAYLNILLPAQQEVGRLWHLNEISICEEHLVSYTTQRVMALLSTRLPRRPDNGHTVIAGAVAGNVHDIGIRAISYLLEFAGWRTIYLGSDIPRQELPAMIDSYEADVLMLSVALNIQLPATERAIHEIRKHSRHPVKILVGGNGLRENPDYWQTMGADGFADSAQEAIELAGQMVADS